MHGMGENRQKPSRYIFRGIILMSAFALFTGASIYILLRPSDFIFYHWLGYPGYSASLLKNTQLSLRLVPHFPEWFIYSLPDGLWAFAYSLLITSVWSGSKSRLRLFWMASIPILVFGFEFLQLAGIIKGTFSITDLLFGLGGLTIGILVVIHLKKLKNYEKSY